MVSIGTIPSPLVAGRSVAMSSARRTGPAPASPITQGLLRDATATLWKPGGLA